MRANNVGGLGLGRVSIVLAMTVLAGGAWRLAAADVARPSTTSWGGDPAGARPGEIVIRPTGRKVKVITLAAGPAAARPATQVRVVPAGMVAPTATTASTASASVARFNIDEGLEYGPQSVRLPLAYDPRDNFGYGCGPITYAPAFCGSVYGGYAGSYGFADSYCGYGGGYGYGYGRGYGYGGGYRHAYGGHYGAYAPFISSFCGYR